MPENKPKDEIDVEHVSKQTHLVPECTCGSFIGPACIEHPASPVEDAPQEPPAMPSMCGRCYAEGPVLPPNCAEKPEALKGQPIGQYHCPDCGAMVLAGLPHPPLCQTCIDRKHPGFDEVPPLAAFGEPATHEEAQQRANAIRAAELGLGRFAEPLPTPPSLAPPDAAAAFVGEACAPNRKAFTSTAEIMAAARGWCDEHAAKPFGPRTLASQLRRMGGQPHSNGTRRGWRGIKLR